MTDELNGLDSRITVRGYFERILKEKDEALNVRLAAYEKALDLAAEEYARRLDALNGEYKRDRERQAQYVTIEKYETQGKAESTARAAALLRVDEKFEDYVKRYEARQREVDLLLAAQKGAAESAQRAAGETGRRSNRNIGIASVCLGALVLLVNLIPLIH